MSYLDILFCDAPGCHREIEGDGRLCPDHKAEPGYMSPAGRRAYAAFIEARSQPLFVQADIDAAVAAEREACAQLAGTEGSNAMAGYYDHDKRCSWEIVADAIRARGVK
jgi:hypothetical protein